MKVGEGGESDLQIFQLQRWLDKACHTGLKILILLKIATKFFFEGLLVPWKFETKKNI